jgi:hypothetical protein
MEKLIKHTILRGIKVKNLLYIRILRTSISAVNLKAGIIRWMMLFMLITPKDSSPALSVTPLGC